jgi:hypothetical protein
MGEQLTNPLTEYRNFLENIRFYGLICTDFMQDASSHLIDMTASLAASLILGTGLTLSLKENASLKANGCIHRQSNSSTLFETAEYQAETDEALRFLKRLIRRAKVSVSAFLVALFYIHRYHETSVGPLLVDKFGQSVIPTFLIALIAADKMVFDATYTSKDWCEFTDHRYSLDEINDMERTFLTRIDYKIWITPEQFDDFISYLDFTLCFRSMLSRWSLSLSYRDLAILTHGLPRMFNASSHLDVSATEALLLLMKIVVGIASTYVTALFASTVVLRTAHWFASSWEIHGDALECWTTSSPINPLSVA